MAKRLQPSQQRTIVSLICEGELLDKQIASRAECAISTVSDYRLRLRATFGDGFFAADEGEAKPEAPAYAITMTQYGDGPMRAPAPAPPQRAAPEKPPVQVGELAEVVVEQRSTSSGWVVRLTSGPSRYIVLADDVPEDDVQRGQVRSVRITRVAERCAIGVFV